MNSDFFYNISDPAVWSGIWHDNIKMLLIKFFYVLLFILVSWILFKVIVKILSRVLILAKVDKINHYVNNIDYLNSLNFKFDIRKIIIGFIKLVYVLIIVVIGADIFNMPGVTLVINEIISYLPRIIGGLIILSIGVYVNNLLKSKLNLFLQILQLNAGLKIIKSFILGGVFLFFLLIALNQMGFDLSLITNNLSIILGLIVASISLSFALGSKDIVTEVLYSYYLKKSIQVGDVIKIEDDVSGIVVYIDSINLKLKSENKYILYPINKIKNLKIEIL